MPELLAGIRTLAEAAGHNIVRYVEKEVRMRKMARSLLIVVSVLNGVAGLVCGVLFIAGPDGHLLQAGALLPVIQGLPLASVFFQDFTWIGVAMLLVLGVPNSIAAVMLVRKNEHQYLATFVAGALLLLWCGFELIFMFNALAVGYFIVGLISILSSAVLLRTPGSCPTGASSGRSTRHVDVIGRAPLMPEARQNPREALSSARSEMGKP